MKKNISVILALVMILSGCGMSNGDNSAKTEMVETQENVQEETASVAETSEVINDDSANSASIEEKSYDEEFVELFSNTLQARWDKAEELYAAQDGTIIDMMRQLVGLELDAYKDINFESFSDEKLKNDVQAYIDSLKYQDELLSDEGAEDFTYNISYSVPDRFSKALTIIDGNKLSFDPKYNDALSAYYNNQTIDKYGAESFLQLINSFLPDVRVESGDDGYDNVIIPVVNYTENDFHNLSFVLLVFNEKDELIDQPFAMLDSWKVGEEKELVFKCSIPSGQKPAVIEIHNVLDQKENLY